jgi:drug/metabolite transporter (DMT)-like permease
LNAAHAAPAGAGLAALALTFNAFTWGVSWWPFRALQAEGLHPLWVTAASFLLATAVLLAWRPAGLAELLRTPVLWVLVLAAGTTNATFNWAVTTGDVVRVVLLFYLMPLWATGLAWAVLGERPTRRALLRVALALAGALLVLWPRGAEAGTWPAPRSLADGLALLGGFSFALNNVMLSQQAHRSEAARAIAMFGGGALVALVIAAWFTLAGGIAGWPPARPGWMLGVAGLALWFLGANLALQYGASRLPAGATAVIMVSEVFFASASAIALGAGTLTPTVALGGALILAAAALAAWGGGQSLKPTSPS